MTLEATKCYALLSQIPQGRVTTYKEIAKAMNSNAIRAVGSLIGKNPNAPKVPCHRVVKSDGSIGGYAFGVDKKIEILQKEGLKITNNKVENFAENLYKFN